MSRTPSPRELAVMVTAPQDELAEARELIARQAALLAERDAVP
ncbi:hypothetical protein [Myceligenerans xiligouense]|nr:hypothetical protein [Myceligenerans xiligouense]